MFAAINKQVAAVNKLLVHPQININMQDNVSVVLLTLFSSSYNHNWDARLLSM